jgi:cytochrome c biogenesis protein CcmG, thiol:disulfide interchange protein DsbE
MRLVRVIVAVIAATTIAACGQAVRSRAPTPAQVSAGLAGSPAPLARLHAQADRLLASTPASFHAVLGSLRGYPVIVNQWGSWCEPCRMEFPIFQQAGVRLGRTTAVVGLDVSDSRSAAAVFLREFPVTYPSYVDPDAHVAFSLRAGAYYPTTLFFDRAGKLVFTHVGPYTTVEQLLRDAAVHVGARAPES